MRMKDDVENRTRVPAPLASRRKFMFAAVATGGAGILSTELPVLIADRTYSKLFYWNEVSKGGHFAALEQPELFIAELRKGFARVP